MPFQTDRPYASASVMVKAVRELEAGLKPHLLGPALPVTHKLTDEQRDGLMENVRRVIVRTIAAAAKNPRHRRAVENQLRQPRFRFLEQIPEARVALETALQRAGLEIDLE